MKIGTVIPLFDHKWKAAFQPLLVEKFDYFEVLPENPEVFSVEEVKAYLGDKEVILHAPFMEANLISHSQIFREASRHYLVETLKPFIETFHPQVITTHVGSHPFIYTDVDVSECKKLMIDLPECALENMPGGNSLWRISYPSTEAECDFVYQGVKCPMTFDVGHFLLQNLDVYALLKKYLPIIKDIHVHDMADERDHQTLGTGVLDVEKFMRILKDGNYQNYLSVELIHDNVPGMIKSLQLLRTYR